MYSNCNPLHILFCNLQLFSMSNVQYISASQGFWVRGTLLCVHTHTRALTLTARAEITLYNTLVFPYSLFSTPSSQVAISLSASRSHSMTLHLSHNKRFSQIREEDIRMSALTWRKFTLVLQPCSFLMLTSFTAGLQFLLKLISFDPVSFRI